MCHEHGDTAWRCKMPSKIIGLMMILIGLVWFGARLGWLDFSWFRIVPLGPLILIMIGLWVVYRGVMPKKMNHEKAK
jgi:hypothetical protein